MKDTLNNWVARKWDSKIHCTAPFFVPVPILYCTTSRHRPSLRVSWGVSFLVLWTISFLFSWWNIPCYPLLYQVEITYCNSPFLTHFWASLSSGSSLMENLLFIGSYFNTFHFSCERKLKKSYFSLLLFTEAIL